MIFLPLTVFCGRLQDKWLSWSKYDQFLLRKRIKKWVCSEVREAVLAALEGDGSFVDTRISCAHVTTVTLVVLS